jgi:hypothetical protein
MSFSSLLLLSHRPYMYPVRKNELRKPFIMVLPEKEAELVLWKSLLVAESSGCGGVSMLLEAVLAEAVTGI